MGKRRKKSSAKALVFCFKHATRKARRHCYQCRRPLCPKCQLRLSEHVFCSLTCHTHYRGELRRERFRLWKNTALRNPWVRGAVLASVLFFGVAVVYLSLSVAKDASKLNALELSAPSRNVSSKPPPLQTQDADWSLPGAIRLLSPLDRAETNVADVPVSGQAPVGAIVGLYVNNTLVDMRLAADGGFRFEDTALPRKVNTIQARYYTRSGATAYSEAVLVFFSGQTPRSLRPVVIAKKPERLPASANNFIRGDRVKPVVFFTFDGGSTNNSLDDVLKALAQHNIHSTFFLTGQFIEKYPRDVLRILQGGHEIGNHTYNHPHLTTYMANRRQHTLKGVTKAFFQGQLLHMARLYRELTGREPAPLWRAPFGEHNRQIRAWAEEIGYLHVGWSRGFDSLDWVEDETSRLFATPRQTMARLLRYAELRPGNANGAVVLMHLGVERKPEKRLSRRLTDILTGYEQAGYQFAKISGQAKLPRKNKNDQKQGNPH